MTKRLVYHCAASSLSTHRGSVGEGQPGFRGNWLEHLLSWEISELKVNNAATADIVFFYLLIGYSLHTCAELCFTDLSPKWKAIRLQ